MSYDISLTDPVTGDILLHDAKTALMYEELRAAIDDGHESMTHADALAEIAAIRAENVELRTGYAAARLEIESLQARIKTMAEEHADELMVAHLDGRMCAAQQPAISAAAEVENLRKALQFYADKDHFNIADDGAWDTVSGEPQNYWCDEEGTATVEDGTIARLALAGHQIKFDADAAPQPTPTPKADSQPAPDEIINMAREQGLPETEIEGVFRVNADDLCRVAAAILADRAPADSVTAPAATCPTCEAPCTTTVNMRGGEHGWGTTDLERTVYHYAPTQAADSVLEDAERYRWLRQEHERVDPVCHLTWKRNLQRDSSEWVNTAVLDTAIDNARKQGANHD